MGSLLARHISQDLPRIRVENQGVSGTGDEQAMTAWINRHIVPAALSADVEGFGNLPCRLSVYQTTCEQTNQKTVNHCAKRSHSCSFQDHTRLRRSGVVLQTNIIGFSLSCPEDHG
jgi:hypothetical protein